MVCGTLTLTRPRLYLVWFNAVHVDSKSTNSWVSFLQEHRYDVPVVQYQWRTLTLSGFTCFALTARLYTDIFQLLKQNPIYDVKTSHHVRDEFIYSLQPTLLGGCKVVGGT